MKNIYTDLAMESYSMSDAGRLSGVKMESHELDHITITIVDVLNEDGERALGKPKGRYTTLECDGFKSRDLDTRKAAGRCLGNSLRDMLNEDDKRPTLVVGLGNRNITPDSLGPRAIEKVLVTRHLLSHPNSPLEGFEFVCAIAPGVLGITGVETAEIVYGVVNHVNPKVVIAIDSLAAMKSNRIATTVQIADTGISPGSGIGNHRMTLSKDRLGIPVIGIGMPLVVYATTIIEDVFGEMARSKAAKGRIGSLENMIVTPREIDQLVEDASSAIAMGINLALQFNLSEEDIALMME